MNEVAPVHTRSTLAAEDLHSSRTDELSEIELIPGWALRAFTHCVLSVSGINRAMTDGARFDRATHVRLIIVTHRSALTPAPSSVSWLQTPPRTPVTLAFQRVTHKKLFSTAWHKDATPILKTLFFLARTAMRLEWRNLFVSTLL